MLSRVADSIYWVSRYIERAENVARFVGVNLSMVLDSPGVHKAQWEPLVQTMGDEEYFHDRYDEATQENVIRFLVFDPEYHSSILSCVRAARENARSIREVISTEMWETINGFYLMVNEAARRGVTTDGLHDFIAEVKRASHSWIGISMTTSLHDEGWHFNRLGRLLERADKTSRLVDVKYFLLLPEVQDVGTTVDDLQWSAVLRSVSGHDCYRQRHHRILPANVMDFLMLDREFPRSVNHSLMRADDALRAISGAPPGLSSNPAERLLGRLTSEFAYMQIDDIIRRGLHEFIDDIQSRINDVGTAIHQEYVALKPVAPTAGYGK